MDISIEEFLYSEDFGEDEDLLASSSSEDELCTGCYCIEAKNKEETAKENGIGMIESIIEPYASRLTDIEFRKRFRVNRNTFQKLVEICGSRFFSSIDNLCEKIAPVDAVYILLWYLGNHDAFKQISKRFKIDKSCIWTTINSGITYLSTNMRHYVEWPKSYEYPELSQSFYKVSKLKNIIGVIGTTSIKIRPPRANAEKFLCSRNCYCLTMQGITSFNNRFLDVFLCNNDKPAGIWSKSPISLDSNYGFLGDGFILGSNCYQSIKGLVTPFPKTEALTEDQQEFNVCLKASLDITTHSFNYLKGRFKRLQRDLGNKDLPFAVKLIQTACVIHNICIDVEDDCEFSFKEKNVFVDSSDSCSKANENTRLAVFQSFIQSVESSD